jgi:hypothetical protein
MRDEIQPFRAATNVFRARIDTKDAYVILDG